MSKLTIDDIVDMRAYEREREEFRSRIIELKGRRRVHVGPFVTFVFENRDTIRFQIQEMARAEKILTDEGIEAELRAYNPLIPEPGNLSATMFIELTTEAQLREWLPKLIGIERNLELRVGVDGEAIRATLDPDHEKQLTSDEVTASVHYIGFALSAAQIDKVATGPVVLAIVHPEYKHELVLSEGTRNELLCDLQGF